MSPGKSPHPAEASDEIFALIETLHQTGQRLEELTAGEVDTVADRDGRTFLLRHAQEQLRHSEAAKQAAILNALPAHIALLDTQGRIISVNEAWRRFGDANSLPPGYGIGRDYLAVCDSASGDDTAEAQQAAAGIRSVLDGSVKRFSFEYPCHSPTEQRWFLMTATPLADDRLHGAVVMHLDLTAERLSEERYRLLFDASIDAILLTDTDGRVLAANPSACRMFGWTEEEILQGGRALLVDASDPRLPVALEERARTGSFMGELTFVRKGGAKFPGDISTSVFRDKDGHARTSMIIRDISGRKMAEQKFKDLLEAVPDAMVIVNGDAEMVLVNAQAANVFGWQREELLGQKVDILVPERFRGKHPDNRSAFFAQPRARPMNVGPNVGLDLFGLRKDGSEFPVEVSLSPLETSDGTLVIATIRDITERKLVDAQRNRLALLVEASPDFIGFADPKTKHILYINKHGRALCGIGEDENVKELRIADVHPAWMNKLLAEVVLPTAERDGMWMGDGAFLHRDGHEIPISMALLARMTDSGEVDIFYTISRDITERKTAERRIAYLNRVYAMLTGINTLIVRVHDRDELFREACRVAVEQGQFRLAWIGVADWSAMKIVPIASAGADRGFLDEVQARLSLDDDAPAGHGPAAEAIRQRQAVVVNDIQADPRIRHKNAHVDRGIRSLTHLPVLIAGEPVAVLGLHAAEAGFFDEQEMKLLQELAGDIAFAIEHIEKEKKLVHLSRIQMLMASIGSLMVRVRDRDELFREACRIAVEAGGFRMSLICMVDRSVMKIVPVASAGKKGEILATIKNTLSSSEEAPKTMVARALREKQAIVANDSQSDPRLLLGTKYAEAGIRSMAILPLIVADEALGVLVLYANETGFFDEGEMRLLTDLAGDIGFTIDHIEKQARLDYLAYYDVLTGLANRSLFLERVAQHIRSAASGGHKLALFLVDLERFKNINDSLGQPAGDALLRQVAEWLTLNTGDANLVARISADHFATVLPEVKQGGDGEQLLEEMIKAFMDHPFRLNDAVFRVAVKVGVAVFSDDGADADALFRHAEAALKQAKASGQRYLFYTQTMTDAVAGKLSLENQLRQALDNEDFVLHYQPKVNLVSGKMSSAEALIRWNDPRTGLVPPGRFIPILEETGMIYDVGRWALKKAIADYLRWRAAGLPAVRIAVNVSALQLRHRGFIDEIRQAIGIDAQAPAGLELEITESLIMADVKGTIASLKTIRDLGVTVAIDDFGTGFSSLAYLAKLPVDTLKIDRSFVIDMTTGPEGLALVSTIIKLAHSLKLTVVAEGVETEEQARLLRLLACDEMQGFLFSKPVPAEVFETRFLAPVSGT